MNTEYQHAGNADTLRDMQIDNGARCELCHYPETDEGDLAPVQLPEANVGLANHQLARTGLLCQYCIEMCKGTDADYKVAASLIRPLPMESAKANAARLKELAGDA